MSVESAPRLLVVEDDADLRALVSERLRAEGYAVETAETGPDALARADASPPDVVILDVMLPGLDGLEVCRLLRAKLPRAYIVMLTAKAGEVDRVVGLEVGADDYVTKPFSLAELVARVRAGLRRLRLEAEPARTDDEAPLVFSAGDGAGDLRIDPVKREVRRGDEVQHLTVKEFELLLYLARHPERPFTRLQLLEHVWQIRYEGYDRTVDSHVQRLRAKIEDDPGNPRFIRTVWGVGYKFAP
ncbi:MAG TPA: response regulator transcription factor [Rhodothermales bacterium]|nr:response regulator transcription factor [Rhodothermales bacterium]